VSIRVLLADDDKDFLDVTAYGLRRAGFTVSAVGNGKEALDSLISEEPDIALLDVDMPFLPGIQACQRIRDSSEMPVVLMSGNRHESEIVKGFAAGADDYLVKPFSVQHLVFRLRAILRRTRSRGADVTPHHLAIGPLTIDLDSFEVTVEEHPVRLTRLEFQLFYGLAANVGRVVSTSRLIDFGWGMDGEGDVSLLKTHFSHIRRKIKEVSNVPLTIRAMPGAGYRLDLPTV
jgi:DNA-binding response OmpR family regulator